MPTFPLMHMRYTQGDSHQQTSIHKHIHATQCVEPGHTVALAAGAESCLLLSGCSWLVNTQLEIFTVRRHPMLLVTGRCCCPPLSQSVDSPLHASAACACPLCSLDTVHHEHGLGKACIWVADPGAAAVVWNSLHTNQERLAKLKHSAV